MIGVFVYDEIVFCFHEINASVISERTTLHIYDNLISKEIESLRDILGQNKSTLHFIKKQYEA